MAWSNAWMPYGAMPWMILGPLLMLGFLLLCIAAFYLFMHGGRRPEGEGALGILKERFARGEIDQAEFEQRRRVLLG